MQLFNYLRQNSSSFIANKLSSRRPWKTLGARPRKIVFFSLTLLILGSLTAVSFAQVSGLQLAPLGSSQASDATALIDRLVGPFAAGVTVSNITYTGDDSAAGVFDGGTGIVGFEGGIVLSSGRVIDAVGPNTLDMTSTDFAGSQGDADLDALVDEVFDCDPPSNPCPPTFDAASLEFDLQTGFDEVFFEYVFTSEEYNEFTNSQFTNIFGFFIDGTNFALLPDATTPVAINSINAGNPVGTDASNPDLFINNDCSDIGTGLFPCGTDTSTANQAGLNIEADGLTVVLGFVAPVAPAPAVNRVKLAIADVGDAILDSWVFVRGGSFAGGNSSKAVFDSNNPLQEFTFPGVSPGGSVSFELDFQQINDTVQTIVFAGATDCGDPQGLAATLPGAFGVPFGRQSNCLWFFPVNPPTPGTQFIGDFGVKVSWDEVFPQNPRLIQIADDGTVNDFTRNFYPDAAGQGALAIRGRRNEFGTFGVIDLDTPDIAEFSFTDDFAPDDADGGHDDDDEGEEEEEGDDDDDDPVVVRRGRRLHVEFELTAHGDEDRAINNATAFLSVARISTATKTRKFVNDVFEIVDATCRRSGTDLFAAKGRSGKYRCRLSTKRFKRGTYQLTVVSNPFLFGPQTTTFIVR